MRRVYKKNGQTIGKTKESLSITRANSRAGHQDALRKLELEGEVVQLSQVEILKEWHVERDKKRREEALKRKPFVSAVSRGVFLPDKTKYSERNKMRRKSSLTRQAKAVQNSPITARTVLAVAESSCTPISENNASDYNKRRKTWSIADKGDNCQAFHELQLNCYAHDSPPARPNHEAAKYFRFQVDNETRNLVKLVQYWTEYKREHEHVDTVCLDEIDVAIGQTKLLIGQKFKTLLDLCDKCRSETSQPPVRPNDLEGFWSTALTQVDNCNRKFRKLSTLKDMGWLEIDAEVPTIRERRNRKAAKTKATSASSGIRRMIVEARRKLEKNRKASEMKASKADGVIANSPQTLQRLRPRHTATVSRLGMLNPKTSRTRKTASTLELSQAAQRPTGRRTSTSGFPSEEPQSSSN